MIYFSLQDFCFYLTKNTKGEKVNWLEYLMLVAADGGRRLFKNDIKWTI